METAMSMQMNVLKMRKTRIVLKIMLIKFPFVRVGQSDFHSLHGSHDADCWSETREATNDFLGANAMNFSMHSDTIHLSGFVRACFVLLKIVHRSS